MANVVAWSALLPCIAMLSVRCIEAGSLVSVMLACIAVCTLLGRKLLDRTFWNFCIGENSEELRNLRDCRQIERYKAAHKCITVMLPCGALFHLSRGDCSGAMVPTIIAVLVQLLSPQKSRFVVYFINGCAFEFFCWAKGGADEGFLWSPVLVLPLWNMMMMNSISTHAALELWRLAALLHFCAMSHLKLVAVSLCFVMAACRVLEANYDMKLVVGCRTERLINDSVNADRRQLVAVLSHELRNRLDILANSVTASFAGLPEAPLPLGTGISPYPSLSHSITSMQQSTAVVLDLLEIETPRNGDATLIHSAAPSKAAAPAPLIGTNFGTHLAQISPMVRANLSLLIHSALKSQLETLSQTANINAAASVEVQIDERFSDDVMCHKSRVHWILSHLIANAYLGCGMGSNARVLVGARLSDLADEIQNQIVFEIQNFGKAHSQAVLDAALQAHQQSAESLTRRWGGHGLGVRHTCAMLKLIGCPPLELIAHGNVVTARFAIQYQPCGGQSEAESEADVCKGLGGRQRMTEDFGIADQAGIEWSADEMCNEPQSASELKLHVACRDIPAPAPRSVLVVDDEEFIRTLTVMLLEETCQTIVTAENGKQGIAAYLERRNEEPPKFDLILMDIQMPVLTGDLAVKQMRALEQQHGWPHTCIIARTANTAASDQVYYKQCGMDGCIPKAGNVAVQVREAFARKQQQPAEFVVIDSHLCS
mmetsp:Transcript_18286/g.30526  ORF Transcript_18286/g.30526 Transcript_18286/m.30526 type:complete len:712 (+) Transcript_18286:40-2175(+)